MCYFLLIEEGFFKMAGGYDLKHYWYSFTYATFMLGNCLFDVHGIVHIYILVLFKLLSINSILLYI